MPAYDSHPIGPACKGGCGQSEARCAFSHPCCSRCTHFGANHGQPAVRVLICSKCNDPFEQLGPGRSRATCEGCTSEAATKHRRSRDRTYRPRPVVVTIAGRAVDAQVAVDRYDRGRLLELAERQGGSWWVSWTGRAHLWGPGARISRCSRIREAMRGSAVPEGTDWPELCGSCLRSVHARAG